MRNPHFIKLARKRIEMEGDDPEVLLTQIRVKAHLLDKEMQTATSRRARFSARRLADLQERIEVFGKRCGTARRDFRWAQSIAELYDRALADPHKFQYPWMPRSGLRIAESEFRRLLTGRRSIRKFTPEEVDRQLLYKILTLANWAPTNCNQQSLRYLIVQDLGIRRQIVYGGLTGTMSPCIVAVLADLRFYAAVDIECPAHDAGAAIQNLLLAAHYYGLGSCYTSSTGCNAGKYRTLLKVADHEKIMALVWLGHYEHAPLPPVRRDVSEVVREL
jgi:nitroreductase